MANQCFETEINYCDGHGRKTVIWAANYKEAIKVLNKEYGVGKNGTGCRIRIVQPKG